MCETLVGKTQESETLHLDIGFCLPSERSFVLESKYSLKLIKIKVTEMSSDFAHQQYSQS